MVCVRKTREHNWRRAKSLQAGRTLYRARGLRVNARLNWLDNRAPAGGGPLGGSLKILDGKSKQTAGIFVICIALIVSGRLLLDVELARFIARQVGSAFLHSRRISTLPDFLLLLVSVMTLISWAARFYLCRKPGKRLNTDFLEYIGSALPLAYIFKTVLKELFGATNTRAWLLHPEQFGFHWFQGGGDLSGFPSGHMAVFTVLILGISGQFPRFRLPCFGLLTTLALALMITEYHFLSDIAAGFLVGAMVDLLVRKGLPFVYRLTGLSACQSRPEGI